MIAYACSCAQPEPIAVELQNSDAVFTGRVLQVNKPLVVTSSLDPIRVLFEVQASWKGAEEKIVEIATASSDASCGYSDFAKKKDYLVFAHQTERGLEVNLCSRTQPLARATGDIALLQSIHAPTVPEGTAAIDSGFSAFTVVFTGIALAVLFAVLWKTKMSKWPRTRKTLAALIFGYVSFGILISIYFLRFGSPPPPPEERIAFIQSIAFFTFLWPMIFALGTFGALAVPAMIGAIAILVLWIKGKRHIALGIFASFLFLLGALFLPVTVSSEAELSTLLLGKPIAFVMQNHSAYNPPLPWKTRYGLAREYPTRILWPQFFLSALIVGGAVSALIFAARKVHLRKDQLRAKNQNSRVKH